MKVAVLQQYLRSLLEPLRASGASAKVLTDLERTAQELDNFRDRDLADMAEFLRRARDYEQQGHWAPVKGAAKKAKTAPSVESIAERLQNLAGTANLQAEVAALEPLTIPQIRDLMKRLGITGGFKKKPEGLQRIAAWLAGPRSESPASPDKLARVIETLKSLKAKADAPDAPFDEIEAELQAIESRLDAREAIQAATSLGVIRSLNTRADAIEAIRRKVLEVKLARESIAY